MQLGDQTERRNSQIKQHRQQQQQQQQQRQQQTN